MPSIVKLLFLILCYFGAWTWGWQLAQGEVQKTDSRFFLGAGVMVAALSAFLTVKTSAGWAVPFLFAMTASVASDIRAMVVSDKVLVLAAAAWVLWQLLERNPVPGLVGAATGLAAGLWLDWLAVKVYKTPGFGGGDTGILGLAGLYLGAKGWWIMLTAGSIAGLFCVAGLFFLRRLQKNQLLPFVPFLYIGALVALAEKTGSLKIFF